MVALTVPSIAFSIGTKPRSTSPEATASSTAVMVPSGTRSASARSGWVSRASWVKVAAGPEIRDQVAGGFTVGQDRAGHGRFLASLADRSGRRGRVHARRRRAPAAAAALRRPGVRPGRPSPRPAPGHARGRLRAGQVTRALRRRGRGAARAAPTARCCSPGPTRARSRRSRRCAQALGAGPGSCRGPARSRRSSSARRRQRRDEVVVVTAGTADLPVATECVAVLAALGLRADLADRLRRRRPAPALAEVDTIAMADAVVVMAGMEGALASVVGGLTPGAGGRRADQHRLRRRARGRDCVARHALVVLVGRDRRRASTTATGPPAPWPGFSRDRRREQSRGQRGPAERRWPGSTASPASPVTWRSARWSTRGPTRTRWRPC